MSIKVTNYVVVAWGGTEVSRFQKGSTRALHCAETHPACIARKTCVREAEATWEACGGGSSSGCGLRWPMGDKAQDEGAVSSL
jgi:hypothetical protein